MAVVLRLANVGQTTTVDLRSGILELVDRSWRTRTAPVEGQYRHTPYGAQPGFSYFGIVVETMDLVGVDTVAHLVGAANDIEEMLELARLFHTDPLRSESIWLEVNADGESARRALLYKGSLQYPTDVGISALLENGTVQASLALSRHPLWEDTVYSSVDEDDISCLGGTFSFSSVAGVCPARLWRTIVRGRNGGGGPLMRFWCGIRPKYLGLTDFTPLWELEDGTAHIDTSEVVDVGASGGKKLQVTFATQTDLIKRAQICVAHLAGGSLNSNDFYGRYLVLVRAKLSGSGTCAVQMKAGYSSYSGVLSPSEIVYIDNTNWRLWELGEIQIPPGGVLAGVTSGARYAEIQVWAERVSGTPLLDLDCLVLIPATHFLYGDGAEIEYVIGATRPATITVREDDLTAAQANFGGTAEAYLDYLVRDWYLPVGDSMFVLAAERNGGHYLTDAVDVDLSYFPRWLSYRGS